MNGNSEYKILYNANDFKTSISPYGFTWSDTPTTDINKCYHDTAKGHIVANSGKGSRGYFYLIFDDTSVGDIIEMEMSVKTVEGNVKTGNCASIGIHHIDKGTIETNAEFVQQKLPSTTEWETVKFKHYCTETRSVRIDFGVYSNEVAKFYIKFARATVHKLKPTV